MNKDPKKGFGALADMKKQLAAEEEAKRAPPPPPPKQKQGPTKSTPDDDAAAFARAMAGVKQLGADTRGERIPKPKETPAAVVAVPDEVDALVDLASAIDIDPNRGIDPRIVRKLERGEFPISAQLDLHGKRKVDAEHTLERFIKQARAEKSRCVLVITGRGLHSDAGGPVLKEAVQHALSKTLLKHVLAFCPARPEDGGDGALYVLLRRR